MAAKTAFLVFFLTLCLGLVLGSSILKYYKVSAQAEDLSVPASTGGVARGVQVYDGAAVNRLSATNFKFDWVKFQYRAGQPIDQWIKAAKDAKKKVMVSVDQSPADLKLEEPTGSCDSGGYKTFRDFMEKAVKNELQGVDAIEIWNEPNLRAEWPEQMGKISGVAYANLLQCGVEGIKAGASSAKIISAGLSPNPDPNKNELAPDVFLQEMGVGLSAVDFIGAHVYSNQNIPPDSDQSSFNNLQTYVKFGNDPNINKKIWVSEFGWQRCDNQIDVVQQQKFIDQGFEVAAKKYPQVEGMIVWNFGFAQIRPDDAQFKCYDIEGATTKKAVPVGAAFEDPNASAKPLIMFRSNGDQVDVKYIGKKRSTTNCPGPKQLAKGDDPRYMVAPTLQNDSGMTKAYVNILTPPEVGTDINDKSQAQQKTQAGVNKDFLSQFGALFCDVTIKISGKSLFGCVPDVKVGTSVTPNNQSNITEDFALRAEEVAKTNTPSDMDFSPATNDCNVFDVQEDTTGKGNQDVNKIQALWAGSLDQTKPDLSDHSSRVDQCLKDVNLRVGSDQLPEDRRVAETDISIDEYKKGMFPEGVDPPLTSEKDNPCVKK